ERHREMLREYYRIHGYDPDTGIPTRERLESLDIPEVADRLYGGMPYRSWEGPPLWPLERYPSGNPEVAGVAGAKGS
ncbi:MAG: hypothetical protein J7L61_03190, partial [Thermoplasmata archaeon]|nr:hypothetical protein [Thermoplasmata archaeon]